MPYQIGLACRQLLTLNITLSMLFYILTILNTNTMSEELKPGNAGKGNFGYPKATDKTSATTEKEAGKTVANGKGGSTAKDQPKPKK